MVWRTWRGVLGGSVAAALLLAPATATLAQTATSTTVTPTKPAAKPAAVKTAAKKPSATHPAKTLATAKPKAPVKKLAAAPKKPEPAKKLAAVKKPAAAPDKVVAAAPKPTLPSYTVTTTRGNVTYTATRFVPIPTTIAAISHPAVAETKPETKIAAVPVSLTQPAPSATTPATTTPAKEAAAPIVVVPQPSDPKVPTAFVSAFLKEAFRIARESGATSLQRRAQLADLFASKMDVKRIAGYTTSDELAGMSPDIQQRFRTILVSYLVETYYPRLELASDPSVTVDTSPAEPMADGSAVVWTTFTKDGWGSQSVKWQLQSEDGQFKIVDIYSAGASLVQMERDTFLSVMRNGGFSQLMAKLDARTKELATAATE